ncbi:hypothetical protein PAL_GLEAN10024451 [Pteropus alecto]|uniref:Uncharacterized protein n=1 Tax=Pteropus alecto TaxID=9402 RepID=L5JY63_PTEAL|nr:hypothetical protein PAL_GLEAN10024451 [Pteropus alecto]
MGRKSSSVNKESKRYSACEAPVLLIWATRRALPHGFLCAATRHQKQQFEINMGHSRQPCMEM